MKYTLFTLTFLFVLVNFSNAQNAVCFDTEIELNEFGEAIIDPTLIDGGSTGTGEITYNVSPSMVTCSDIGMMTVALTITDEIGNSDVCFASVFVADNIQPTMICNEFDWTVDEIISPEEAGVAVDNCSITQTLVLPNSFDQPGNYSITLVAFDAGGNANTCISFVNVEVTGSDTESPTISECADLNLFVETDNLCEYVVPDYTGMVIAEDNVTLEENLVVTQSPVPGTVLNGGNIQTVIFTVTDEAGLSASCNSLLQPVDIIAPTIVNCPNDITVELDGNYEFPNFANDISTYDNCSDNFDLVVSQSPSPGFLTETPNSYEVTLASMDVSGNVASCNFNVILIEENNFSAVCQDTDIYLAPIGVAIIEPSDIDGGSYGVGELEFDVSQMTFDCSDIGVNSVQLIVSDGEGLGMCDAAVTVLDSISPVAFCQDLSLVLDGNGNASVDALNIDNGSVDNCSIISYALSNSEFNASNIGSNDIELTVMDFVGNTSTCISQVTVLEGNEEMAHCIDIAISLDENGVVDIEASDIDNGSSGEITDMTLDLSSFNCSHVGSNTVTLTASFGSGNVASCTSMVTVEDNSNPTVLCQDVSIQLNEDGAASIQPTDIELSSFDNCGVFILNISQIDFIDEDIGPNDVELTATDDNGNSASCTASVTVIPYLEPSFTCPGDMSLDGNGDCTLELPDFQSQCSALNFCDESSLQYLQEPVAGTVVSGTTTVTMTVIDICGNLNVCSFSVTIDGLIVEIQEDNGTLFTEIEANNYQWYDCGGNPIIGANMPSYTPSESGSYNVSVIANSCSGSSDCIDVTIASIEETTLERNLILYPNPNQGLFKINLGSEDYLHAEINVLNELGQIVHVQNESLQKVSNVNVEHLPAGIYYLTVFVDGTRSTRSFVIE